MAISMLALFIMQVLFLAVGIFLGCTMKHYKQASSVAVSIILGTFFLSILSGLNKNLEFLKYFTPFKYFDAAEMLRNFSINLNFLWISLGIIVVSLAGAFLTYKRRDLYGRPN